MKNPFGDQQVPGSYHNLKERMYKRVSADVNEQILNVLQKAYIVEILQRAYEEALAKESIVLSRPERKRLFSQIIKMVMEDIINRLDGSPKPNQ